VKKGRMSATDEWIAKLDKRFAASDKRVRARFKADLMRRLQPIGKVKKTNNQWPGLKQL
jgi:hypothetical protein